MVSVTPASAAGSDRHVLAGTKPAWVSAVPRTGNLSANQVVSAKVWLAPRNASLLDRMATAVSDPASAMYAHYITAAQYNAMFAPTSGQLAGVTHWLTGSGLRIDKIGPNNSYVAVSGRASAINAAFATQLATFKVNGRIERAPAAEVSVPTNLAATVMAVTGLTTLGHRISPADLGAPGGFRNDTPCSAYYGQQMATTLPQFNGATLPYDPCGYTPTQFRNAYGVTASGKTGAGQTVAITDAFDSSHLLSDANTYATNRGDSAFASGQFQDHSVPEPDPSNQKVADCGGNGWYGEQNLDVEAVHGMAPSASVWYYGAFSCYDDDLLAALAQVVSDNQASIVTNSWGEPTFVIAGGQLFITIDQGTINAYESVFKRGAVQGIGFYFSSGDSGDEVANTCYNADFTARCPNGFKHPDWPTGDTWVTSVGGTALAIGQNGNRIFETGWGTSQWRSTNNYASWNQNTVPFQYGAGGGYSQVFKEPGWQKKVVAADPTGGRAVPDVGLDADPTTGMLIGITQNFPDVTPNVQYGEYRIGGTSLASPLMAGLQADAQQGRARIGFASPLIYSLAKGHGSIYYDVTPQGDAGNIRSDFKNGLNTASGERYSVRTFDQDSSLVTGPGWDDVSGVGAPTAAYIAAAGSA
jgi:subtilase family serine protease